MRADRVFAYGATVGLIGDRILGDPRRGHPVAAFGRAAAAVERALWRDDRARGVVHTLVCAGGAAAVGALGARAVRSRPAAARIALTAAATWAVVGGTSLGREAVSVYKRQVVESVAENTSDAVVGALVWGAAAGVPGLLAFRAVNTLDAMVGHKSPRHLRYGWASARLDDLAGWPGARLTALAAVLAGPDRLGAVRAWRADAGRHPSPNAGPVEASFAGALGVRLGGTLSYGGRVEHRAVLNGAAGRPVEIADIERAVRLSQRVTWLALGTCVALRCAVSRWSGKGRG